jgi:exosome complex RNA-binding protein Csl4
MSAIVRRWIRAFCGTCRERTVFELSGDWTFVCTRCRRTEVRPASNGLLATA